ncbi:MAG: nuclear transport factor 2 family protein [Sphingomonadaceae bacterium]
MDTAEILLAIEEIKKLKARYFRFMDTKDWNGLATIFTDDATFDARASLSVDGKATGGPASESNNWITHGGTRIIHFIQGAIGESTTCHHGHCHEIELLSPTEARGVIAMEDQIFDTVDGAPVLKLHGCGHYHENYRKTDGRWQISHSRLTRLYVHLNS